MTCPKFRRVRALLLAAALCLPLAGCVRHDRESTTRIFAMDTIMTLTLYGEEGEQALPQATQLIYDLQDKLSVTGQGSEIWALNHSAGAWTPVSGDTCRLLQRALELGGETGGALDITAYSAVHAWGFTTGEYRVPGREELDALVKRIDYTAVEVDEVGGRVRLPNGMQLDLGSVAKGYTGQRLAAFLKEQGVESAILNLGGNVQAVGKSPDGKPWRVAIQDPQAQDTAYLASVEVEDQAVITSGSYQRYFEEGGTRYWHIMDPATAAPARSGLVSVSVVGSRGTDCDALSTALFVMGEERGAQFWRDHPELEFDAVFVGEDGAISITQGLKDSFELLPGYTDRKVTVIS